MTKLTLVRDETQIAASHQAFVRDVRAARSIALDLIRRTRYWVYDPASKDFSPSKFSGYVSMDFRRYRLARNASSGAKFDGGLTQNAIARVLGNYAFDHGLMHELIEWVETRFGAGALAGIRPEKWLFARLPEVGVGGLAALAGGWEGSDELVDSLAAMRRTPGRTMPDTSDGD